MYLISDDLFYQILKDHVRIGRHPHNDFILEDDYISRFHAEIFKRKEGFALVDCDSSHGTFVNGVRVRQQLLKAGDVIQLAHIEVKFLDAKSEEIQQLKKRTKGFTDELSEE